MFFFSHKGTFYGSSCKLVTFMPNSQHSFFVPGPSLEYEHHPTDHVSDHPHAFEHELDFTVCVDKSYILNMVFSFRY